MMSEEAQVTAAYLEHLTDRDLALLSLGEGLGSAGELRGSLRSRRGGIEDLLVKPELFQELFASRPGERPLVGVSPFLVFAAAVQWAARELRSAPYLKERVGAGWGAPVFDVARLRDFLSSPWSRLFLAELLASFNRVASGSVVVVTPRGFRRQRFSELDPVRLASLLEVAPAAERPGLLRRLGDLALFLTGVFPDYVARRGFGPVEEGRLLRTAPPPARRSLGGGGEQGEDGSYPGGAGLYREAGPVALLEQLGQRWYRAASELLPHPAPRNVAILGELPEHFSDARRVLRFIAERLLFSTRERWFGLGGA
jgi:hypothetical protein